MFARRSHVQITYRFKICARIPHACVAMWRDVTQQQMLSRENIQFKNWIYRVHSSPPAIFYHDKTSLDGTQITDVELCMCKYSQYIFLISNMAHQNPTTENTYLVWNSHFLKKLVMIRSFVSACFKFIGISKNLAGRTEHGVIWFGFGLGLSSLSLSLYIVEIFIYLIQTRTTRP